MRTETTTRTLYRINELPTERAKEYALDELRQFVDYGWHDAERQSLEHFLYDVTGRNNGHIPYDLDYPSQSAGKIMRSIEGGHGSVRGLTLASIDREAMPTGYCADSNYRYPFYDEFRRTGSAWKALEHAIAAGLRAWAADVDACQSDEYLMEHADANEYEFAENGELI
jgi:hypothetical protein